MKATLRDPVFGPLAWEEESQTYTGTAELRPSQTVPVELIVHNADEFSPREFAAFLACAREQWLRLRRDDGPFRRRAAELFRKASRKASRHDINEATVMGKLTLLAAEIHVTGITMLRYGASDLWPKKRFPVTIDGSDNIIM